MNIGFIGFGKMGSAIADGIVNAKLYKNENVFVYDISSFAKDIAKQKGFNICNTLQEVFDVCNTVLLAIKPQELSNAINEIKTTAKCGLIISIMAGVSLKTLQKINENIAIARIMPNTCALIGESASSICYNAFVTDKEKKTTQDIFSAVGEYVEIDESLMDEVIPIGGSFTAYAYTFMKAFVESSIKRGISREVAEKLVIKSMIGSANMFKKFGDIDTLIKNVCSKGGTTLAGLEKFEENKFEEIIDKCAIACAERSKELGKLN